MPANEPKTSFRVLVVFAALPSRGSEPGVGWGMILASARLAKAKGEHLCVVLRCDEKEKCEEGIRKHSLESSVSFFGVAPTDWGGQFDHLWGGRLGYLRWRRSAKRTISVLCNSVPAKSIHQATWATAFLPHACPRKYLKRFLWGPVTIPTFPRTSWKMVFTPIIDLVVRLNVRGVRVLVAGNDATLHLFRRIRRDNQTVVLEPNVVTDVQPSRGVVNPNTIALVGLLVRRKRPDLALQALASAELTECQLHVIGDGPLFQKLCRMSGRLGLSSRVFFHGWLTREDTLGILGTASVLVHPSEREGSPFVVGEAASLGVPVVVFNDTGAATVARLSGQTETIVERGKSPVPNLVNAVLKAISSPRPPATRRWEKERLIELLQEWWGLVTD